jgi:high-affinity Fe2+/Pb2+ permease
MKWPQITLIVLWALNIGMTMREHGKSKIEKANVWTTLFSLAIVATLLYYGGFWG